MLKVINRKRSFLGLLENQYTSWLNICLPDLVFLCHTFAGLWSKVNVSLLTLNRFQYVRYKMWHQLIFKWMLSLIDVGPATLLKKALAQEFLWILRNFKEHIFLQNTSVGCLGPSRRIWAEADLRTLSVI